MSHLALTPAEVAQSADLIVDGTVIERAARWNDAHTMIFTDVRLSITQVVHAAGTAKSAASAELTLTFAGGAIGDTAVHVSGQTELLPGRRYLLFTRDDGGVYLNPLIGGAQGLFEVLRDEASGESYLVTAGRRPVTGMDASNLHKGPVAVRGFRAGMALTDPSVASRNRGEAAAPTSDAAEDSARPVTQETDPGPAIRLEDAVRVVREQLLHAPVLEPRFQRETTESAARAPRFENSSMREVLQAASDVEPLPLIDPRPAVPLFVASDDLFAGSLQPSTNPMSAEATEGGTLGVCGYHSLSLNMQQVPTSWWSFSENNTAMWTWNQFMDVFRFIEADGTYGNNSQNEFCGWPSDADLARVYGFHWNGWLAATMTWSGCECCRISQSDIAFNPAYSWTTSMSGALSSAAIPYLPSVMHELGHALGMQREIYDETYDYDVPTVMHGYNQGVWEDGLGLHAADAYLLRRQYDDQRSVLDIVDVGVESYAAGGGLSTATLSTSTATSGQAITVSRITVENMSRVAVPDVRLRLYLSPSRSIGASSLQMGSHWSWSSFPGEAYSANNFATTVPWNTPGGRYYVGARVTRNGDSADGYGYNDVTWLPATLDVNNPRPTVATLSQSDLSVGRSTTITISGSGFVPGVTRASVGADIPATTTVTAAGSLRVTFAVPAGIAWGQRSVSVSNAAPGGGIVYATQAVRIGVFVRPGDADQNNVVDERDILPIGRYYGYRGPVRASASTTWSSQALTAPWTNLAASHADCNGDGVVNATDVQAIVLNWRRTPGSSAVTPADVEEACATLLAGLDPTSSDPAQRELRQAVMAMLPAGATPQLRFAMELATPNPSRGPAMLAFVLPTQQQEVRVSIYSAQGQLVWERIEHDVAPGRFVLPWDGRTRSGDLAAPGLYLTRVSAGGQSASARLVRLP